MAFDGVLRSLQYSRGNLVPPIEGCAGEGRDGAGVQKKKVQNVVSFKHPSAYTWVYLGSYLKIVKFSLKALPKRDL